MPFPTRPSPRTLSFTLFSLSLSGFFLLFLGLEATRSNLSPSAHNDFASLLIVFVSGNAQLGFWAGELVVVELRGWYWVIGLRSDVLAVKWWELMRFCWVFPFLGIKLVCFWWVFFFSSSFFFFVFCFFHLEYTERVSEMVMKRYVSSVFFSDCVVA